ncbi:AMP-binding protein [Streptomyces sp. DSM 40167]|uniref:AMP-binding protein n=1 Tax=Streptomyces sp. DSM 40167 TaxID=2817708 RepID=UPI0035946D13
MGGWGSLRRVVCSGEVLSGVLAERFVGLCGAELHNLYGPTETSVDSTAWVWPGSGSGGVSGGGSGSGVVVPLIGGPIWNTRVFVLDGWLRPVAPGVVGGVVYRGGGVGSGVCGAGWVDGGAVCGVSVWWCG